MKTQEELLNSIQALATSVNSLIKQDPSSPVTPMANTTGSPSREENDRLDTKKQELVDHFQDIIRQLSDIKASGRLFRNLYQPLLEEANGIVKENPNIRIKGGYKKILSAFNKLYKEWEDSKYHSIKNIPEDEAYSSYDDVETYTDGSNFAGGGYTDDDDDEVSEIAEDTETTDLSESDDTNNGTPPNEYDFSLTGDDDTDIKDAVEPESEPELLSVDTEPELPFDDTNDWDTPKSPYIVGSSVFAPPLIKKPKMFEDVLPDEHKEEIARDAEEEALQRASDQYDLAIKDQEEARDKQSSAWVAYLDELADEEPEDDTSSTNDIEESISSNPATGLDSADTTYDPDPPDTTIMQSALIRFHELISKTTTDFIRKANSIIIDSKLDPLVRLGKLTRLYIKEYRALKNNADALDTKFSVSDFSSVLDFKSTFGKMYIRLEWFIKNEARFTSDADDPVAVIQDAPGLGKLTTVTSPFEDLVIEIRNKYKSSHTPVDPPVDPADPPVDPADPPVDPADPPVDPAVDEPEEGELPDFSEPPEPPEPPLDYPESDDYSEPVEPEKEEDEKKPSTFDWRDLGLAGANILTGLSAFDSFTSGGPLGQGARSPITNYRDLLIRDRYGLYDRNGYKGSSVISKEMYQGATPEQQKMLDILDEDELKAKALYPEFEKAVAIIEEETLNVLPELQAIANSIGKVLAPMYKVLLNSIIKKMSNQGIMHTSLTSFNSRQKTDLKHAVDYVLKKGVLRHPHLADNAEIFYRKALNDWIGLFSTIVKSMEVLTDKASPENIGNHIDTLDALDKSAGKPILVDRNSDVSAFLEWYCGTSVSGSTYDPSHIKEPLSSKSEEELQELNNSLQAFITELRRDGRTGEDYLQGLTVLSMDILRHILSKGGIK